MSQSSNVGATGPENEQPFVSHLIELRDRLLRIVLVVLVLMFGLFFVANDIYTLVAQPLMERLPTGATMIATEVASPFLTPLKLTLVVSILLAVPYILHQIWAFVAPGLYAHEQRLVMPLLATSTVLFYVGVAFAYFLVLPTVFEFLIGTTPDGVAVMTDIGKYLDFVLTLFFAFGVAFEVPVATIILVVSRVTTPDALIEKRPYVIVGAFVAGAILTPPDVISQTMLAIPVWLLFEAGVYFSRYFVKPDEDEDEAESENLDSEAAMDSALDRYIRDEQALQRESENMAGDAGLGKDAGTKP